MARRTARAHLLRCLGVVRVDGWLWMLKNSRGNSAKLFWEGGGGGGEALEQDQLPHTTATKLCGALSSTTLNELTHPLTAAFHLFLVFSLRGSDR